MSAINCVTTEEPYCGHVIDNAAMHLAIELYACQAIHTQSTHTFTDITSRQLDYAKLTLNQR